MGDKTLAEHIAELDDVIESLRAEIEEVSKIRHQLVIASWRQGLTIALANKSRAQPVEGER